MALELFDADGAVALDLNVADRMIGEPRLIGLAVRVALQNVDVDLVAFFVGAVAGAVAMVELPGFLIDQAAVLEKLAGILDGYFGAARPLQPQPGPTAEQLTQIINMHAVLGLAGVQRLQVLLHADGRHHLRHHPAAGGILFHSRVPVGFIKAGRCPARLLAAGVVGFAAVEVVADDGAGGRFPARARCDSTGAAVGVLDVHLHAQARRVAVAVLPTGFAVPAIAQHYADGIGAGLQLFGHVVGHVEDALGVIAGGGVEYMIADPLPVEVKLVPAQAGDVEAGAADRLGEVELIAQEG